MTVPTYSPVAIALLLLLALACVVFAALALRPRRDTALDFTRADVQAARELQRAAANAHWN